MRHIRRTRPWTTLLPTWCDEESVRAKPYPAVRSPPTPRAFARVLWSNLNVCDTHAPATHAKCRWKRFCRVLSCCVAAAVCTTHWMLSPRSHSSIFLTGLVDQAKVSLRTLDRRLQEKKAALGAGCASGASLTAPALPQVVPRSPCDRRCVLFPKDEAALTDWIIMMGRFGDPPSRLEVEWMVIECLHARQQLIVGGHR